MLTPSLEASSGFIKKNNKYSKTKKDFTLSNYTKERKIVYCDSSTVSSYTGIEEK